MSIAGWDYFFCFGVKHYIGRPVLSDQWLVFCLFLMGSLVYNSEIVNSLLFIVTLCTVAISILISCRNSVNRYIVTFHSLKPSLESNHPRKYNGHRANASHVYWHCIGKKISWKSVLFAIHKLCFWTVMEARDSIMNFCLSFAFHYSYTLDFLVGYVLNFRSLKFFKFVYAVMFVFGGKKVIPFRTKKKK